MSRSSPRALRKRIGTSLVLRTRRQSSNPLSPGIMMSSSTQSTDGPIQHRLRLAGVQCALHAEALGLEEVPHHLDDGGVVVHDQHRSLVRHRCPLFRHAAAVTCHGQYRTRSVHSVRGTGR